MNNLPREIEQTVAQLVYLLLKGERITDARLERALKGTQLTKAKLVALQQLIEAGEPLPLGQLAERLHCVKSNATAMVDRLEAEGLAERLYDKGDRRTVLARATEEGQRRYHEGLQATKEVERELMQHFTPEELRDFIGFLSRLETLWE